MKRIFILFSKTTGTSIFSLEAGFDSPLKILPQGLRSHHILITYQTMYYQEEFSLCSFRLYQMFCNLYRYTQDNMAFRRPYLKKALFLPQVL